MSGHPSFTVDDDAIRVGIGECAVSRRESIVTFGLGSCVAICLYDPAAGVGGLAHVVLPRKEMYSSEDSDCYYADAGARRLYEAVTEFPSVTEGNVRAKVVGGGHAPIPSFRPVGGLNMHVAQRTLRDHGVPIVTARKIGDASTSIIFNPVPGMLIIRTAEQPAERI